MVTGPQVRQACSLLRWTRYDLNRRTALPLWSVDIILSGRRDREITPGDSALLGDAFDRAGVEFTVGEGGAGEARLKRPPADGRTA